MKIIKLTETGPNNITKPLYVNAFWIKAFCLGDKKKDTLIQMYDKSYYFVKETSEEILATINFDNKIAPIVMDADEYAKYQKLKRSA